MCCCLSIVVVEYNSSLRRTYLSQASQSGIDPVHITHMIHLYNLQDVYEYVFCQSEMMDNFGQAFISPEQSRHRHTDFESF